MITNIKISKKEKIEEKEKNIFERNNFFIIVFFVEIFLFYGVIIGIINTFLSITTSSLLAHNKFIVELVNKISYNNKLIPLFIILAISIHFFLF